MVKEISADLEPEGNGLAFLQFFGELRGGVFGWTMMHPTCKAAGGVRAQFSDPVNIALGLRGLDALAHREGDRVFIRHDERRTALPRDAFDPGTRHVQRSRDRESR